MDVIQWLQASAGPAADTVWLSITQLGSEEFFLLAMTLVFWCVDAPRGWLLGNLFLVAVAVNDVLKGLIDLPRPTAEQVRIFGEHTIIGSSFPSGHAQYAAVFWGYLAWMARRPLAWAAALAVIVLVGASRLYLGLHWPRDIAGGFVVGAVLLAVGIAIGRPALREEGVTLGPAARAGLLIAPVVVFVLFPWEQITHGMGVALGLNAGYLWLLPRGGGAFPVRVPLAGQGLKLLVGWAGLLVLRVVLKAVFPEGALFDFLRYAALGLWAGWLAPVAFGVLLARRGPAAVSGDG